MKTFPSRKSYRFLSSFITVVITLFILPAPWLSARDHHQTAFTLSACVKTALQNNPQLLASGFTVKESKARIKEVQAGFYPTLSFSSSASQSSTESALQGTGAVKRDNWNTGLSVRYPIFQGFKTIAASNAAKANFLANAAQYQSTRQELILQVTEAYYRLLQSERLAEVSDQSVHRAQKHLDFANARFKAGLANRADILKAMVEHSNAQLTRIRARNARLSAQGILNISMGRPVYLPFQIVDDLETVNTVSDSNFSISEGQFKKLLQLAFQIRPELDKITRLIRARQANIRFARSDYFPTLSLDASYNYSGNTVSDLNLSPYIGMSISLPLFAGFARPARVRQEELALHNLGQQQESIRQQIGLEVWNAYLKVKEAGERVTNSQIFCQNALENRHVAEGKYREGVGSMLDVIDAQTAFITAKESYIESLADLQIARAVMEWAVGKKFEEIF